MRLHGPLKTNSSEVVREAAVAGIGIALRSTWDVAPELKSGRLVQVLPGYAGSKRVAIHAVYPSRRHLEQKVRAFVDFLRASTGRRPIGTKGWRWWPERCPAAPLGPSASASWKRDPVSDP